MIFEKEISKFLKNVTPSDIITAGGILVTLLSYLISAPKETPDIVINNNYNISQYNFIQPRVNNQYNKISIWI